ncbi:MAG: hypothetical protein KDD61_02390 [Bdellovibrionales bacterium]|nr:hypothetical protein [Bdellovibrionales bacterium]
MKKFTWLIFISIMASPYAMADGGKKNVQSSVIQFDKNSAELSSDQREQIAKLVSNAEKKGEGMHLGIAAWSDQSFPGKDKTLSEEQQSLADRRAEVIDKHVKSLKYNGELDTYNMAEKSNWLADLFNSSESELKSTFAKEEKAKRPAKERYQVYREKGGSGKAVLVLTKGAQKNKTY